MSHSPLLISGASGRLGQTVVQTLLQQGIQRQRPLILVTRTPEKLAIYQQPGVEIRQADFDVPAGLDHAFLGAKRMLLISTNVLDGTARRVQQHRHAIDAAVRAGIEHIVYTSFIQPLHGLPMPPARDHLATEKLLEQSGLRYTCLRNAFYYDMLLPIIEQARVTGTVSSATAHVATAYIAREDCAKVAAQALVAESLVSATFTLTGQTFSMQTLADSLSAFWDRHISYLEVSLEQKRHALIEAGWPPTVAEVFVSIDQALSQSALDIHTGDFRQLTGLEPKLLKDFIAQQRFVD